MSAHLKATLCTAVALWCAASYAPACAGEVLLGYGATYASGTHRGIDVAAAAGEPVVAAAAGTVVFAGTVPADGGGTCIAVTIQTADGLRVSVLPLASAVVAGGADVASGDELGTLAATGDDSSAAPHLHLSLRRGDSYLDPSGLIAATPSEQAEAPVTSAPAPVEAPGTPPAGGAAAAASSAGGAAHVVAATSPFAAAAPTSMVSAQPAASTSAAIRATHARIPIGADVPAPSELQSHVTLGPKHRPLHLGAPSQQTSLVAIGALVLALAGMGATRLRAAENHA